MKGALKKSGVRLSDAKEQLYNKTASRGKQVDGALRASRFVDLINAR